jgi:hypothetical protein
LRLPLSSHALVPRAILAVVALCALAACGGSSGSNPAPPFGPCNPDAQVTLARPLDGSTGVPASSITSIEIVAFGNNNQLFASFAQYQLVAVPASGTPFSSNNNLSLTSDPNGFHPFPSDFYYTANFNGGQFVPGNSYGIYLNVASTNCRPSFAGSFST